MKWLDLLFKIFGEDETTLDIPDHTPGEEKLPDTHWHDTTLYDVPLLDDAVDEDTSQTHVDKHLINPASGLPMINGTGGMDVGGNLYGDDTFNNDDGLH